MANEVNYNINYDDERFQHVQADKQAALKDVENTYGGMIAESDKYYQAQIDASKQWADKQTQLQQEQTDFAIQEIEQDKAQAKKDYTKEQSGAYVDWQKQSNEYGVNAEKEAAMGMGGTGFSESSQVAMYTAYQNRVAVAREAYTKAVQGYDNAITQARLQNNSILAEIAFQSLQQQLELSLQGFQYKNNLILEQANKKLEVDNTYYARYQDVLNQINTENALAEEIRQFDKQYKLEMDKYEESIRQFNEEIKRLKAKDAKEYEMQIKNLELEKEKVQQERYMFNAEMQYKRDQLAAKGSSSSGGGSSSSGKLKGSSSGSGSSTNKSNSSNVLSKKAEAAKERQEKKTKNQQKTYNSIMDLGYGPVSAEKLNSLVASGKVKEETKNGVQTFTKNKLPITLGFLNRKK
ncbi:MAG: hypothetical protein J6B01_06700 [Ruminococcus sp.]|nr:hypothetical protein [Bacteroidaceae bacterium]MBO5319476.1 hypothetical protein [Ruminococcus sp.]